RIRNMLDDATLIRLLSGNNDYMSRGFGPFFGQINEEELYRLMPELRTSNVSGRDIERAFTQGNLRTLARDYSNFFYDGQRRLRGEVLGTTGYMVDIRTRRDKSISDGKEKVKEMKSAELFYHRDVDTGLRRATGRYYEDGRFQEYSAAYSFGRRYEVGGGYIQDEDNKTGVLYGVDKTKLGTDKKGIHPYLVGAITRDVKVAGERSSTALGIVGAKINLGNPTSLGSFYGTAIAGFGSNNDYLIAYRADYGSAYGSGYGSNGLVRSAAIYQFGGGKERGDSLHLAATESKETINKDRGEYSRRERSYEAWTESYRNPEVSYRQTGIGYMQRDDKRTDKSTTSTDVYARAYDTRVGSQSTTTLSLGYFRSSRDNKPTVKTEREYTMSEQKGNFLHIHGSTTLSKGSSQTTGVTISTGKSEMTTVYDKQGSYSMRTDPQRITVSTVTDGKNLATGANVEFRLGKKVHTDGKGGTTTSVDYVGGTYYSYGNNQKPTGMVTYTREEQRVGGYTRAHVSLGNLYGQGYYEAGFMYGRSGRNVDSQIGLLLSSRGISVSYGVRW
ncbi:MAG: hypothetical protein N3E37_04175, partial [Candidatus Micrarchaeota archaeon]|nr:hypothetical protein [Candidatus Micrarchaeota archaeon]